MKSIRFWRWVSIGCLAILVVLFPKGAQGGSLVVNKLEDGDDGTCNAAHCTLREAINAANNQPGPDTITFSVTGTIETTGLPALTDDGTVIDASEVFGSGPLGADAPGIKLQGPPTEESVGFLISNANNVRISGLFITGFGDGIRLELGSSDNIIGTNADGTRDTEERNVISGVVGDGSCLPTTGCDGIEINGGTTMSNTVAGNFIGTDESGANAFGNGDRGIFINNAPSNVIGGSIAATRNIISGNEGYGIRIEGGAAMGNTIVGNYIGTDVTGSFGLGNGSLGIYTLAPGNTIGGTADGEGNVISDNSNTGILVGFDGDNTTILGNFIGTDWTGTTNIGNSSYGVRIQADNGVIIGGITPGAGNVISGNPSVNLFIQADGVIVLGNYIGININGTGKISNNGTGVDILNGANNIVGGSTEEARNIISANDLGIRIYGGLATGNVVQGNYMGTDITGSVDLGNDLGVKITHDAQGNMIGGVETGAGNLISGNGPNSSDGHGILLDVRATENTIIGNTIGLDSTGSEPLENSDDGVYIKEANGNTIGGTASGEENIIAFNGGNGVTIQDSFSNTLRANAIFANTDLGIDLDANSVTPNDEGDSDSGANNWQNFPVLTTAIGGSNSTFINGTFHSRPLTTFSLDFYANSECDGSDYGEGEKFLGSTEVTTDNNGDATFAASLPLGPAAGQFFATATATDPGGNTSEFSECLLGSSPFYVYLPTLLKPAPVTQLFIQSTNTGGGTAEVRDPEAGDALLLTCPLQDNPVAQLCGSFPAVGQYKLIAQTVNCGLLQGVFDDAEPNATVTREVFCN